MYLKEFLVVICALGCFPSSLAQIAVVDIELSSLLNMQQGLGWPHKLNVSEGHEALLSLQRTLDNQEACIVTTPSGTQFNVASPPSNRFQSWGEGCGVRVRNVEEADEGRWRLTATRGTESIAGWSEVFVERATNNYTGSAISLQDGETHTDVLLTSLQNSYCVVAQPFSDSSLVPGQCRVTLEKTTRAVQGNWNVLLGIPGRVQELHVERRVAVEAERLDVGYVHDTVANKLHLYCNIQHTHKNITFCRFQKTTSVSGYNMVDGLSDGTHSYYGDGFLKRECGMTIENPTSQDYGTWRCSVGVQQWAGTHIEPQTPMQALISVAPSGSFRVVNRFLREDDSEPHTVFVTENVQFTIMCRANVSLAYCWFQHPNGTQFTPTPIVDEEQPFWYTGESLQTGDCGITLSHASQAEEGTWLCHMGGRDQLGVEYTDRVDVRVTGPLAAHPNQVDVAIGEAVILNCHTSNGNRPLEYCRFLTPGFVGLNVDSTVTDANALLGRFHFTPEKHLDYGDCSLTISRVEEEDIGEWTCAALINEDTVEARDIITLNIQESTRGSRHRAGIVGMAVGLSVLIAALGGFVGYKYRHVLRMPIAPPSHAEGRADIVSFDNISNAGIRFSISTNSGSRSSTGSNDGARDANPRNYEGRILNQ